MAVFTIFRSDNQGSSLEVDFYLQARDTAVCWSLFEKLCSLGLDAESHVLMAAYIPCSERAQEIPWFCYSLCGRGEGVTMEHLGNVYYVQNRYENEIHLQDKVSPELVLILNSQEDGLYRDGANKEYYAALTIEAVTIDGTKIRRIHNCGFCKVPELIKGGRKS